MLVKESIKTIQSPHVMTWISGVGGGGAAGGGGGRRGDVNNIYTSLFTSRNQSMVNSQCRETSKGRSHSLMLVQTK